jgi:alpha-1,6-mannosyltransferase
VNDFRVLRAHGLPGAIGSGVLAIGALSLGWLPPLFNVSALPVLGLLRSTGVGEVLGRAAVLVGGALILQSWLLLGTDVLSKRSISIASLQRILAVWIAPALLVPPLFSRDPYSYFVQGKLLLLGLDPYTHGAASVPGWFRDGVDPMWAETPTPYGPLYLLMQKAVAQVAQTPYWSAVAFRLVAVMGIACIAYAVPRLAERQGIDPAAATWLAAMNPLVLLHFAFGGHNDAVMVGFMLIGLDFALRKRAVASVLWIAAAVAIKPIAFVVVPFAALLMLPWATNWWRRVCAYALSGVTVLALVLGFGYLVGVGGGWVQALTTPGAVRTWLSPSTAIGMAIGLIGDAAGNRELDAIAVTGSRAFFMALAVGYCLYLLLRPEKRSPIRGALLALTAIIGLGPVVQPWYLLWALPLVATSGMHKPWHLKATVLGTAGFVIYALAEPSATSDAHLDLVDSLGMVLAGAVVLLVLLSSPRERALTIGNQFAKGLAPLDEAARQRARSWVVQRHAAESGPALP